MSVICYTYQLHLLTFVTLTLIDGHTTISQPSCPSSCFCDEDGIYVSCVGDNIWEFETEIPRTAVRLEIRNYNIQTLRPLYLDQMTQLEELKLQQTKIDSIVNGTFNKLNKLKRLDLSENQIQSISEVTFQGLHYSLRYLDLSLNYLTDINECFVQLINVEQLNLRSNKISQLNINTFLGLVKLQYLNLDLNQIKSIEIGTFIHLPHLAHLILSSNPLTHLTRIDSFGSRLQYIDISNISLDFIPSGLPHFVRDLHLAQNNITQIMTEDFDSYPYLNLLVLDKNKITFIEADAVGRLQYLKRLWLNQNHLKLIPLDLPSSLTELHIQDNHIEKIEIPSLQGLYNLQRLSLQGNQIKYLGKRVFADLINLQSLDLHRNKIEILNDETFVNLTKLESLDLSENYFHLFQPRCLIDLTGLKVLLLSHISTEVTISDTVFDPLNNIKTLEMYNSTHLVQALLKSNTLHKLTSLQEINIMQNSLVNLPIDFPSFFPQIKTIKINGNNWYCDQQIMWLASWLRNSNNIFHRSYSIRCMFPPYLKNKPIALLTENDFLLPLISSKQLMAPTKKQSTNVSTIKLPNPWTQPFNTTTTTTNTNTNTTTNTTTTTTTTNTNTSDQHQYNSFNSLTDTTTSTMLKQNNTNKNIINKNLIDKSSFTQRPKLINTLIVPNFNLTTTTSTGIINTLINQSTNVPTALNFDTIATDDDIKLNITYNMTSTSTSTTRTNFPSHAWQNIEFEQTRKFQTEKQLSNTGGMIIKENPSNIHTSILDVTSESPLSAVTGMSGNKFKLPMYTIMSKHKDNLQLAKLDQTFTPDTPERFHLTFSSDTPDPFHHINDKKIIFNKKQQSLSPYSSLLTISFIILFIILIITISLFYLIFKYKRSCPSHFSLTPCGHFKKEIQYCSQNDEISILSTNTTDDFVKSPNNTSDNHHGLGNNNLYFAISTDSIFDITRQTFSQGNYQDNKSSPNNNNNNNNNSTMKW